jgi:hypothetical protein
VGNHQRIIAPEGRKKSTRKSAIDVSLLMPLRGYVGKAFPRLTPWGYFLSPLRG